MKVGHVGKQPSSLNGGLESVSQTRPICQLRINLDTCKSNEKQLYLLKSPNSLQEGPCPICKQGVCTTN